MPGPKDPKGEGTSFSVVSFSCVMAIQAKEEDSDEDETEESEESEESVKDKKKSRPQEPSILRAAIKHVGWVQARPVLPGWTRKTIKRRRRRRRRTKKTRRTAIR